MAEARAAGCVVTVTVPDAVRESLGSLPSVRWAGLARGLHEGLANAGKHAPAQPIRVEIEDHDGGTRLTITNPLAVASTGSAALPGGFGLTGLEERFAAADGWMRTTPHDDRFVLQAWVPWR